MRFSSPSFLIRFSIGMLVCVSGILGAIFFSNYAGGAIPLPGLWMWVSILAIIMGFGLTLKAILYVEERAYDDAKHKLEYFMMHALKIPVDLDACDIRMDYITVVIHPEDEGYDDYLVLGNLNSETIHKEAITLTIPQALVIANPVTNGKMEQFVSQPVKLDEITLRVKLHQRRHSAVYVDRNDRSIYYFDLEFLNAED